MENTFQKIIFPYLKIVAFRRIAHMIEDFNFFSLRKTIASSLLPASEIEDTFQKDGQTGLRAVLTAQFDGTFRVDELITIL